MKTRVICEWNLLFWRLDLAYFREKKDLSFGDLAVPVKYMEIPNMARETN